MTFFVSGSQTRAEFGQAPQIQFNFTNEMGCSVCQYLEKDMGVFTSALGVKFFDYGPRLWMIGENYPLQALVQGSASDELEKIVELYPTVKLTSLNRFYRLRINPGDTTDSQFDAPPVGVQGTGRFDSPDFAVMYSSPDLQTCLHEMRTTVVDDVYSALIKPAVDLRILDLTVVINEGKNEFESIDIGLYLLFMGSSAGYPACRMLAKFLAAKGYDGVIYPSYFSHLRSGEVPFETSFGLSNRVIPGGEEREAAKLIPNLAIFGRPIEAGKVEVVGKNRVILRKVDYELRFGPVL